MSELTDLLIQIGQTWGWGVLILGLSLYQLYWPAALHPSKPKAQKLVETIPPAVVVVIESIAEEIDSVDEDAVHDELASNGYSTDDFKRDTGGGSPPPADD